MMTKVDDLNEKAARDAAARDAMMRAVEKLSVGTVIALELLVRTARAGRNNIPTCDVDSVRRMASAIATIETERMAADAKRAAAVIEAYEAGPDYKMQPPDPAPPHCREHPVPYPGCCASCGKCGRLFKESEMFRDYQSKALRCVGCMADEISDSLKSPGPHVPLRYDREALEALLAPEAAPHHKPGERPDIDDDIDDDLDANDALADMYNRDAHPDD